MGLSAGSELRPTIDNPRSIHFVGICGTAMASVAAAFKERGIAVSGSDQGIYPPMSTFLEERGIEARPFDEANLTHKPDLVVIGNAISRGNPEAEFALEQKLDYCSLPELLKHQFLRGKRSLVVTGTHGKTTTTSLLTCALLACDAQPTYAVGGLLSTTGRNADAGAGSLFVAEADESDGAFLVYSPFAAVVTNVAADHLDQWGTEEAYRAAFTEFVGRIDGDGFLVACVDDPGAAALQAVAEARDLRFVAVGESEDAEVRAVFERIVADHGRIDLLVNNAGISAIGAFDDHDVETHRQVLAVNHLGSVSCTQAALPALRQSRGHVVVISSVAGFAPVVGRPAYVAAKHGVAGITKAAALEYAKSGIRVNAVCPGYIQTPMVQSIFVENEGYEERVASRHPIGRLGESSEIAEAVLWLSSDAASFVTGHNMPVDGGYMAQ